MIAVLFCENVVKSCSAEEKVKNFLNDSDV